MTGRRRATGRRHVTRRAGGRAAAGASGMAAVGARARRLPGWVRRWYGANPLHLLALLAAFALAGYAVRAVIVAGQWRGFAVWFIVAIIAHDLLLFPLYTVADLPLRRLLPRHLTRRVTRPVTQPITQPVTPGEASETSPAPGPQPTVISPATVETGWDHLSAPATPAGPVTEQVAGPPLINYVRIPVAFSLLLLVVFFPLILGLSQPQYHRASGLGTGPYLWRWLAITGVMFAASAVTYAWRLRRLAARARHHLAARDAG